MSASPLSVDRHLAIRVLALSERTFARLEADGVIVPTVRGRGGRASSYDLKVVVPAVIDHVRGTPATGGDREARARRDRSHADLNELRLAQQRKELLPRDQVVREGKAFILATRAKLLALPRRLVVAGLVTLEQQQAVADLVREALEEMSRWSTLKDLAKTVKAKP